MEQSVTYGSLVHHTKQHNCKLKNLQWPEHTKKSKDVVFEKEEGKKIALKNLTFASNSFYITLLKEINVTCENVKLYFRGHIYRSKNKRFDLLESKFYVQ